jgi:hypothetical protein
MFYVGEEHQQRRALDVLSNKLGLRSFNLLICYPLSFCLLVKNTNKGEEALDALSNILGLRSFNLFICFPTSFCLLVKNTNKGEVNSGCSLEYIMSSFIQFHLLSSFILFVGEEHQQRRGNTNKGGGRDWAKYLLIFASQYNIPILPFQKNTLKRLFFYLFF